MKGSCGDHSFELLQPAHFIIMNYTAHIENPYLWWPLGYGEQPLYQVTMELLYKGEPIDNRTENIGLRTIRLERCFEPGNQEFKIYVNEKPIFVKGTNWVPLDAFHSRDGKRLQAVHDLVYHCGCNMVRCWGGNVYEDHNFYDLCDKRGILIWQDFAMGNTNYPQSSDFVRMIEEEIGSFVCKVRNHPSIAFWCSDNEIDYKNQGFQLPNRESCHNRIAYDVLPGLIRDHDPYRVLIKSSPEIPADFHMYNVPEQHLWGARAWYKDSFYMEHTAKFISEFGFHGCPAPSSIRKFIPSESLWPLDNKDWAVHSTEDVRIEYSNERNIMMRNHIKLMYGEVPGDLETFAILSQLYQGEALKTMMEECRRREDCNGLIWWNMIDCWPQLSDSVVDYYYRRKIAYFYMQRCQAPVLAFMGQLKDWFHPVFLSNHTDTPIEIELTISDGDTGAQFLQGIYHAPANTTLQVEKISSFISEKRLLVLNYKVNGENFGNHFITGAPPYNANDMLRWFEIIRKLPEPFSYEA